MTEVEQSAERICWVQVRALQSAFMDDEMARDPNLNICPSRCSGSERRAVFIGKFKLPLVKVDSCPLGR